MSIDSSKVFTKRVHIFKAGPQISAQGVEREFTPNDLQQVVDSYDPATHEAPLVIGHSGDNDSAPSFGWVKKFVRKGEDLYADVDFTDTAKDLVKNGHYRKFSVSFYSPESPVNPHKGQWSARHLALLGAAPPSVKGLESFSFSEKGVFDFATASSIGEIFDEELGPTLLLERGPLEILKEKLQEVRGEMNASIQELEENQEQQSQANVDESTEEQSADEKTAPENPAQQFSEMKKKLGREGAEASDSAQKLADLETEFPEEKFEEGISRRVRKGAHGQEVQVVEQVFEEDEEMSDDHKELPAAFKKNMEKMKAKAKAKADHEEEAADHRELPPALRKNMEKMKAKKMDEEEMEDDEDSDDEYAEVSHKTVKDHKVSFGKHAQKDEEDPSGRGKTGRSDSDSYGNRQMVGEGDEEDRDSIAKSSEQDQDRVRTAKSGEQDEDRVKTGKSSEEDGEESRWADQPEGKKRVRNMDQYDDGEDGLPDRNKPGTSDGEEPRGRDGGPTSFTRKVEEEPDSEDITVPLESTKGNKVSRVLHTTSGQKRAELKGGSISDHSEESDGVTRVAKKAAISSGSEPRGRDDGPTDFPVRSEEDPDDMELAVDLESVVDNPKVRVLRQKSGEKASVDHSEDSDLTDEDIDALIESILSEGDDSDNFGEKLPYTKTGKGSTYGSKKAFLEDEDEMDMDDDEDDDYSETESYCGTGSMGQSRSRVYPVMFDEFRKQLESLKKENAQLKKEYQEHRTRNRKEKIAESVNSLYTEGKLTDGVISQRELQSYCEGLEFGTLEFSEGETPATKLLQILDRLPNMVYFGEVVSDGVYQEDESELDPHTRALRMVESGECSDYVEAIKRCIDWGYQS